MTRGRLMYTTENKSVITIEFNGDMAPAMECGEYILETIHKNNTIDEFKEYIKDFNAKFFKYEGNLFSNFSYNLTKEVENLKWTDYVYIYEKLNETLLIYHFGKLLHKFRTRDN